MTFKVNIVQINFSQLNLLDQIVMELFHSPLELTGNIPHGLKYHSPSLLKTEPTSKPDIIKSIRAL